MTSGEPCGLINFPYSKLENIYDAPVSHQVNNTISGWFMQTGKIRTYISICALLLICVTMVYSQIRIRSASVKNIGEAVNTPGDEFFPSITEDGSIMVFNKRPPGEKNSDIYISFFKNGSWTKPDPLDIINSPENDETPFITADGKTIIFASNRKGSKLPPVTENNFQYYTEDLYISHRKNGMWSKPVTLKGDVNTIQNERAPSLSRDGSTLYFSRWPLDDIEESRIMMAGLHDGEFKNIREMPYPVNSSYSDYGLMVSKSKPGFYFSSNRRGGYGLWDLFFAHFDEGKVIEIINLGPNINSSDNELSLTELGDRIFFCSNREGGVGNFDIYEIKLPKKITDLAKNGFIIKTIDRKTGMPVPLQLEIQLFNSDEVDNDKKNIRIMRTDESGTLTVVMKYPYRWLIVRYNGDRYKSFTREYRSVPGKMQDLTIKVEPVKQKVVHGFTFPKIYFALDSSDIDLKYIPSLHRILDYMRKNRDIRLIIEGYADRRGEHYYNVELSLRRAISVRDYFLSMGMKDSRFEVLGKGYDGPIYSTYGEENDDLSRKVEFHIID